MFIVVVVVKERMEEEDGGEVYFMCGCESMDGELPRGEEEEEGKRKDEGRRMGMKGVEQKEETNKQASGDERCL